MEGRLSTSTPITTSSGSSGIDSISSLQSSGIQSGKSSRGSPYRKESDQDTDPTGTAAPTEAGGDRSVPESEPYEKNPDLPPPIPEPAFLVPYRRLWSFATPLDFGLVLVGTLAAAANGAALPFVLYMLGRLVDSLGSNQQDLEQAYREICQIALILVYLAAITVWITWLEVACWMYSGERQAQQIRTHYLKALLSQDIEFFDTQTTTGETLSILSNDMLHIHEAVGEKVGIFIHNLATFIVGILVAFIQTWQVALLTLGTVPLMLGTGVVYGKVYTKLLGKTQASYEKGSSIAQEAFSQIRTVYSFVGENRTNIAFRRALEATTKLGVLCGLVKGIGVGMSLGIVNLSWALQLWFGGILVRSGGTNGGAIMGAIFTVVYGGMALGQAIPEIQVFTRGRIAAFKIFQVVDRHTDSSEGDVLHAVKGTIEFRNVHFTYRSRPDYPVFENLSFKINAGETVAIVGSSGSGKSTVISLIERFYSPTSGEVTLDGRNIDQLQLHWLRKQISLVGQEPVLFAGTIRQNILHGKLDATETEVEAAAMAANAHSFICKFPGGYETPVGERGLQLSGGQKQRLAIARAIVKKPAILLLDEATSALDVQSELLVQHALDSVMEGRTTVIVAHRMSSVKNADMILVLDRGKVVERGTHADLLQRGSLGVYANLVRLQERQETRRRDDTETRSGLGGGNYSLGSSPPRSFPQSLCASPLPSHLQSPVTPRGLEWQNTSSPASPYILELPPSPASPSQSKSAKSMRIIEYLREKPETPFTKRLSKVSYWSLFKSLAPEFASSSLGTLGAIVTGSLSPLFTLFLFDIVELYYTPSTHKTRDKINFWCLVIAGIGVASICSNIVQHFYFNKAGENASSLLRIKFFESIMKNEVGWFDAEENASSILANKMASCGTMLKLAISDRASSILQYSVSLLVAVVLAFVIEWKVAVVVIVLVPFTMMAGSLKSGFMKQGFAGDLQKSHEKATQVAGEAVSNIRTVASFCMEEYTLKVFSQHLKAPMRQSIIRAQRGGFLFGLSQALNNLANAMSIWYIALMVKNRHVSYIPALKTYQILSWMGWLMAEAMKLFPELQKGVEATKTLLDVTNRRTEIESDAIDGLKPTHLKGRITFQNVMFSYPTRPTALVLSDFDLTIPEGETVALVGPSGSGKSSIIALMERFYDPTAGKILLDEFDIKTLNLKWLRSRIGHVQQEPALFAMSIRENIQYGRENASEDEVVDAARKANAHGFISGLPNGYDTQVGERGVQLSGGQKQRIAISRAIIRNPQILLLDEATSALDSQAEKVVQDTLDSIMLQENRTTVVIAHRLSSVRHADSIGFVLNGQIIERGSHATLMRRNGAYARLVNLQNIPPSV
ncbi:hypothetical protein Mapa_006525 [Marchantia paleacea]|nr:hypothetical protein Mapa_006525 [Marchantia paleacea]